MSKNTQTQNKMEKTRKVNNIYSGGHAINDVHLKKNHLKCGNTFLKISLRLGKVLDHFYKFYTA